MRRQASSSSSSSFSAVLAQGPTSTPDPELIEGALSNGTGPGSNYGNGSEEGKEGGGEGLGDVVVGWALAPVWGVLDALKWAGQTVNDKAVRPVVRSVSPAGWAGYLLNSLKNMTPQRARDLARIFGNATMNIIGLTKTEAGAEWRGAAVTAIDSFSGMISTKQGRDLVIDGATGLVKLADALNTPQTKDAVHQGALVLARVADLAASNESKAFMANCAQVLTTAFELANSPAATVMMAEITANVVHALEMEHFMHDKPLHSTAEAAGGEGSSAVGSQGNIANGVPQYTEEGQASDTIAEQQAVAGMGADAAAADGTQESQAVGRTGPRAGGQEEGGERLQDYESEICDKFTAPSTPLKDMYGRSLNPSRPASQAQSLGAPMSELYPPLPQGSLSASALATLPQSDNRMSMSRSNSDASVDGVSQEQLDGKDNLLLGKGLQQTPTPKRAKSAAGVTSVEPLPLVEEHGEAAAEQEAPAAPARESALEEAMDEREQTEEYGRGQPRYSRTHFEKALGGGDEAGTGAAIATSQERTRQGSGVRSGTASPALGLVSPPSPKRAIEGMSSSTAKQLLFAAALEAQSQTLVNKRRAGLSGVGEASSTKRAEGSTEANAGASWIMLILVLAWCGFALYGMKHALVNASSAVLGYPAPGEL